MRVCKSALGLAVGTIDYLRVWSKASRLKATVTQLTRIKIMIYVTLLHNVKYEYYITHNITTHGKPCSSGRA